MHAAATCTNFTTSLLDDMSGALTWGRLSVWPGMVIHDFDARSLVLNSRIAMGEHGAYQVLQVARLSHQDARGIVNPLDLSRSVAQAHREEITAEAPQPSTRRWWLAVALDARGRYAGANGFRDGAPCTTCADRPTDPARPNFERCRNAHSHAWNQVGHWEDTVPDRIGRHYVLGPIAETLTEAREVAAETCERLATFGHL
ncbi:hypothetical protein ACFY0Z_30110 [Streptomyces kronopolitis]|uniref:hypothetical protein n=1 Tax=Streptomyces kronopolitis TaxID=1612435 RepID=UPI00369C2832